MKNGNSNGNKNVSDLSEEESEQVKNLLINDGKIITHKPESYDKKFFQVVMTSAKVVKTCLFACFALYVLLNLFGIISAFVYKNLNLKILIGQTVGCVCVTFLCVAIFKNINTDKKSEKEIIYISDGKFIFNYNNGIVGTPRLFYCLSFENLQTAEFEIYGTQKHNTYGRVIFTFNVLDYNVIHVINSADITEIENYLVQAHPTLSSKIIKDGKPSTCDEKTKRNKIKSGLYSLACLVISLLFIITPLFFDYFNSALILAGCLLLLTAVILIISPYLYTYHLQQGLILSTVFIIIGYLIPLFVLSIGKAPFLEQLSKNSLLLLLTFFGNIGLTFYLYIVVWIVKKIRYKMKNA